MKKLLLSLFITLLSTTNATAQTLEIDESTYEVTENCQYENPNYCGNNSLTNGLDNNQTTLFYMYSTNEGHFFLDPLAEYENVIFVGLNDYLIDNNFTIDTTNLHHGKRFIGTFTDSTLWELEKIEAVVFAE